MYHLFETEMRSISEFNEETLRWFSIGSFCLNAVIAIVIGYAYVTSTMSEFGHFCYKMAPFLGIVAFTCFGFGTRVLFQKKAVINQIKRETRTEGTSVQR
jgi:hypothetical protein